jgi:hypothetical protein
MRRISFLTVGLVVAIFSFQTASAQLPGKPQGDRDRGVKPPATAPPERVAIPSPTPQITVIPGKLKADDRGGGNFALETVNSPIGGGVVAFDLYIKKLDQPGAVPHLCWRPASDGVQAIMVTTCTTSSSSLRYKTDLKPFVGGLEVINRLNPITFTRKREGTRDVGLAAEEVERAEPLLAFRNDQGEIEGVKYELLGVVFINAFKEQQAQTRRQQELINQQQTQLARQGQQINALRKLVLNMRGNRRAHQKTARLRID